MAGFLRKKNAPSPAPPPPAARNAAPSTPLFARFTTSSAEPSQRIVSSPMALAGPSRRDQSTGFSNGAGLRGSPDDSKQIRQNVQPAYAQTQAGPASNGKTNSFVSPAHKRRSSPSMRTQTLPPVPPTSPPQNRRLSHVPTFDKPLPTIAPHDINFHDQLGTSPPQSSLPANRRASARSPAPAATQNFSTGRVMSPSAQSPRSSVPNRSLSDASPSLGTRPLAPPATQAPPAKPNAISASSQRTSRYLRELPPQDLRPKISAPNMASDPLPSIPVPTSLPRQTPPVQWNTETGAPVASSLEQDPASFYLLNSKSTETSITPEPEPASTPDSNMGATISSFEVQSFRADDVPFKINTRLLPAQHIAPANNARPKRTPSSPVKGRPLIFAAMDAVDDSPSEKEEYDPYRSYPSPPTHVVKPPFLPREAAELDTSKAGLNGWDMSQSPPPSRSPLPANTRLNGNAQVLSQPQVVQLELPSRTPPKESQHPRKSMPSPVPAARSITPPPSVFHEQAPPTPHSPRLLTKARPATPQRKISSAGLQQLQPIAQPATEARTSRASTLMLDDDPFAKAEGVRMLKPTTPTPPPTPSLSLSSIDDSEDAAPPAPVEDDMVPEPPSPSTPRAFEPETWRQSTVSTKPPSQRSHVVNGNMLPSPVTPEEYRHARSRRRGDALEKAPPSSVARVAVRETRIPGPFPLARFATDPHLLEMLLPYLSFWEWCVLSAVTKVMRKRFAETRELREVALQRYLHTVGYARWAWEDREPLELTFSDLHDYMRGVTLPTHEYSRVADAYVQSFNLPPAARDPGLLADARNLTMSTRAYTRVVLRLRAQAEREASEAAMLRASLPLPPPKRGANGYASNRSSPSRTSSRAPSPISSSYSHGQHSQQPVGQHSHQPSVGTAGVGPASRSPLFRVKRAPLLRTFVPSPDGDWLSDKSVLECEEELKRAGVSELLRMGDVVWDIAVGDEGNIGRLVWDGSYLIDLDYKYSAVGDLPQYLPTLAFPPSYFHRVIRTGPASANPVVHIDISPWGQEIAANLQLLQDRIRTETPQGAYHNVVRWVHRSSFVIRAPAKPRVSAGGGGRLPPSPRIPIPETAGLFVDPGWYGTIVVETEGTNEALADLQDRCPGAFPPRAGGPPTVLLKEAKDAKKVFKILRERSRPSEIWIRAVGPKERLF